MANIRIQFLVERPTKSGTINYFWQPSAALVKAGWKSMPLGQDQFVAMQAATARNAAVEAWKNGGSLGKRDGQQPAPGTAPRVATRNSTPTVAQLIEHYKAAGYPRMSKRNNSHNGATDTVAPGTAARYRICFNRIEAWAGDFPLNVITPEFVADHREALLEAHGHEVAHSTLTVLRILFRYARGTGMDTRPVNPAADFGLAQSSPRSQVWDEDGTGRDYEIFDRAAKATGTPELMFAIELFTFLGQRLMDVLRITESQWRPVANLPTEDAAALAHHDGPDAGRVMGIYVRQRKTGKWVGVPVAGDLRRQIEAQIVKNRSREIPVTTLLINEHTGRPWSPTAFCRRINMARAWAAANEDYELGHLQIRDLRRTSIVKMGELNLETQLIAAISGHSLATVNKILEVYMPRTTKMAARAVIARMQDQRDRAGDRVVPIR